MKILGIETSCDETAISIIEAHGLPAQVGDINKDFSFTILGDEVLSQAKLHAEYGGVYPNLAKREHSRNLIPILKKTLTVAGFLNEKVKMKNEKLQLNTQKEISEILRREPELYKQFVEFIPTTERPDIDAIAVTYGPGLEPALWVGINFAKALSLAWNIPVVAVDHMEGHILAALIKPDENENFQFSMFNFPALALLISGGHTEFTLIDPWMSYKTVGQTRDDAVGEAFDKTARLLGLPYPGGVEIARLAAIARDARLEQPFKLPRPMIKTDDLDLSFSGLKTAVLRLVKELGEPLSKETKTQIAREVEDAITDVLIAKTRTALEQYDAQAFIIGGGVSANTHIRNALSELLTKEFPNTTLLMPDPKYATDNALMIALTGYFHAQLGKHADPSKIIAKGTLSRGM